LLYQKFSILSREILWGGMFIVLSMFALLYLQVDKDKIFISFLVMLLAYFILIIYFIHQVCLKKELKKLFKDYLLLPKTPEKNMLIEMIVGRRSLKGSDSVFVNGKDVSLSALAELFYKQFDFRRK